MVWSRVKHKGYTSFSSLLFFLNQWGRIQEFERAREVERARSLSPLSLPLSPFSPTLPLSPSFPSHPLLNLSSTLKTISPSPLPPFSSTLSPSPSPLSPPSCHCPFLPLSTHLSSLYTSLPHSTPLYTSQRLSTPFPLSHSPPLTRALSRAQTHMDIRRHARTRPPTYQATHLPIDL